MTTPFSELPDLAKRFLSFCGFVFVITIVIAAIGWSKKRD